MADPAKNEPLRVPEEYALQVVWYMWLRLFERRHDIAAQVGFRPLRIYAFEPTEANQALARMVFEKVQAWYERFVLGGEPPPLEAGEGAKRWLRARSPRADTEIIPASAEADEIARAAREAEEKAEEWAKREEAFMNQLRSMIGEHYGIRGAGWKATWPRQHRERHVGIHLSNNDDLGWIFRWGNHFLTSRSFQSAPNMRLFGLWRFNMNTRTRSKHPFHSRNGKSQTLILLAAALLEACGGGSGASNTNPIADAVHSPPDLVAPTVVSMSPADGAVDVAIDAGLRITFSEPMDSTSINGNTIKVRAGIVDVTGAIRCAYDTITFTPSANWGFTTRYTVTISGGWAFPSARSSGG